jgi:hypothetical protein
MPSDKVKKAADYLKKPKDKLEAVKMALKKAKER